MIDKILTMSRFLLMFSDYPKKHNKMKIIYTGDEKTKHLMDMEHISVEEQAFGMPKSTSSMLNFYG